MISSSASMRKDSSFRTMYAGAVNTSCDSAHAVSEVVIVCLWGMIEA